MKGWRECKLGDVVVLNYGKGLKEEVRINGNVPVYSSSGLTGWHNKPLVNSKGIIVGRKGTIGKIYKSETPFFCIDTAYYILPNDKEYDFNFLYYCLQTLGLEDLNSDSAVPGLNRDAAYNQDILLPPLPEQRAIASVLSSLDDKIDLLHRQNKTLEAMAETLFRQWFIEPCKNGLPKGWEEVELGEILSETIGGDWGEDFPTRDTISVICLRGIDLENIKETGFSNVAPLRYVKPSSLEKRKLLENQILIACSGIGPIGKSLPISKIILNNFCFPVIYSNFCKRLQAKTKEIAYVMEFYISQLYKNGELDQFHTGTSIPNFNMKDFLKYKIMLPPSEIINNFFAFLENWYSKKYNSQIRTLEKLRDLLLPKLISGEIRVKYE